MSIQQTFAETIAQLSEMNLADLAAYKIEVAQKAFADPGDPLDLETPREDVDDSDSPFHDATTEAYFVILDLIDQEFERRRA